MARIAIVGAGRMGRALCRALASSELSVTAIYSRRTGAPAVGEIHPEALSEVQNIDVDIVLIATQDDEIANAEAMVAAKLDRPASVLHTSGSIASDILKECRAKGHSVASLHPLVSVSDGEASRGLFKGIYFCIEGDSAASEAGRRIAATLGGTVFTIPTEKKALYHSAAVMTSGHTVALFATAIEMLTACGLDSITSREVLLPLFNSTAANLHKLSPSNALTGPFARADVSTFERDLDSVIQNADIDVERIFLILGERSLDLARQNGIDSDAASRLAAAIQIARKRTEC